MLRSSNIFRMPKPPGTKRNNGKRQEHADNCRICKHKTQQKQIARKSDREIASCRMPSAATNADLQIRGRRCSHRMAHSDPPRLAERGARGVSNTSADFCRLQSLRRTPPYPPTAPKVAGKIVDGRPSAPKLLIFGKLFADQKLI